MYIMLPVVNQTLVGLASGNLVKPFVALILDNQLHEYCAHNLGRECAKAQSGVHAKSGKEDMLILPS